MGTSEVDEIVGKAIDAEEKAHKHDPRIDKMYRSDVITIYIFVVALWIVLWSIFFFVANLYIEDNLLRLALIFLGLFASVFNTVGMVQNTRRLKHESVRFYSQDLYWQDQKRAQKSA
ncbi:MAG: hypothetical protein M5U22_00525 [Thermoleophilia bacterium]|nr:hypothetical protein [Thermoleophilia bacterium]